MKILIVGSKGFIGSHCVNFFRKENEVWECDVVADYSNPNYFWLDAIDSDFSEIFQKHQFDVCINCSGAANVPYSLEKPYNDFKLNTLNVFKLLDVIRLFNLECKFITLSSAAVYGNPSSLPICTTAACSPVSPYGYHKLFAEQICEEYSRFWGVKTCCARIFSAFGPGLKKQLFWDMYNKFVSTDEVTLWGTGNESRDFVYITDIVDAIELIINNCDFNAAKVNIANGLQSSIKTVSDLFAKVLKSEKKILFNGNVRKGDPLNWEADISDLKRWGYAPKVSLEEGIGLYVSWIKNLI